MFRPVQFPTEVESLVRFVEETEPERIIEDSVVKLRDGVPSVDLLRASALAVSRSTDVSVGHHGGPTHPVCGVYPAYHTAQRLSGEWAFLPIVQNVALANTHIHSPEMGPYILPEIQPREAKDVRGLIQKKYFDATNGTLEETRENFVRMLKLKYPSAAEAHLLWLLERMGHDEVLDLILGQATPLNAHDDHYFLFPTYTARALDVIGWEWAAVLLRNVVRWQARNPYRAKHPAFAKIEELIDRYRLVECEARSDAAPDETEAIGRLGERIGSLEDFALVPEWIAESIAAGLSLEAAGEAISIGAARIFLRSDYGNPMDAHLHTGISARRGLLGRPGISARNKLIALLTWSTGPEVTLSQGKLDFPAGATEDQLEALPARDQPELLDEIERSCYDYPVAPDLSVFMLTSVRTAPELRHSMALAQQYAEKGYDPDALFGRLSRVIARDDFTEMHALKQHQATVDEYRGVRKPFRWVHLVSAVKYAAMTHGARQAVFEQARGALEI